MSILDVTQSISLFLSLQNENSINDGVSMFIYYCTNKTMVAKAVNFMHETLTKAFFERPFKQLNK